MEEIRDLEEMIMIIEKAIPEEVTVLPPIQEEVTMIATPSHLWVIIMALIQEAEEAMTGHIVNIVEETEEVEVITPIQGEDTILTIIVEVP